MAVIGGNTKKVQKHRANAERLLKDEMKAFGWGAGRHRSEKRDLLEKLQATGRDELDA